ncbi:hypothetical protein HanIR_Chr04g0166951 [Helianthus annuus]|nr:hypothetical protein HanIR_Chr04g0166951 [Helianthus annuus]
MGLETESKWRLFYILRRFSKQPCCDFGILLWIRIVNQKSRELSKSQISISKYLDFDKLGNYNTEYLRNLKTINYLLTIFKTNQNPKYRNFHQNSDEHNEEHRRT